MGGCCPTTAQQQQGLYALAVLFLVLLLSVIDHCSLWVLSADVAMDVPFGARACLSLHMNKSHSDGCANFSTPSSCIGPECVWVSTGHGDFTSELILGPVYVLFCFLGALVICIVGWKQSRKTVLALALVFWSIMTMIVGICDKFWELATVRIALGMAASVCGPLSCSMLCDYFAPKFRSLVLGIFMCPIILGPIIAQQLFSAVASSRDWRWASYLTIFPSFALCLLLCLTVREPSLGVTDKGWCLGANFGRSFRASAKRLLRPSYVFTVLGSCFVGSASGVIAIQLPQMLGHAELPHLKPTSFEKMVASSALVVGLVVGGLVCDRQWCTRGLRGRMAVFTMAAVAVLVPVAMLFFIPVGNAVWSAALLAQLIFGIVCASALTLIQELLPADLRAIGTAFFFTLTSNALANLDSLLELSEHHHPPSRAEGLIWIVSLDGAGALFALLAWLCFRHGGRDDIEAQPLITNTAR